MSISRSNINLQVTRGNKMTELESKKASDIQADPSKKASDIQAKPSTKASKKQFLTKKQKTLPKPLQQEIIKFKKDKSGDKLVNKMYGGQVMKRAGGGMSYQLYGGTSKNIRDGNKEVSQFYDKG